jgi:hypothetical protein
MRTSHRGHRGHRENKQREDKKKFREMAASVLSLSSFFIL